MSASPVVNNTPCDEQPANLDTASITLLPTMIHSDSQPAICPSSASPLKSIDSKRASPSKSSDPSTISKIRFFDDLPPDVGLHIARILVTHASTDDTFNFAMLSQRQKSYIFQAMDYKLPTHYNGKRRARHWIALMNGNVRQIDISESKDLFLPWTMDGESLCCMIEYYQLDLNSIEKVTVHGVPSLSLLEFLPELSNLRSLSFTGQLDVEEWNGLRGTEHGQRHHRLSDDEKTKYRNAMNNLIRQIGNLPLEELRLECTSSHDSAYDDSAYDDSAYDDSAYDDSGCIQGVIFHTSFSNSQTLVNRSVRNLCVTYNHGRLFLDSDQQYSRYREIKNVFPRLETLICLKAPLQDPISPEHLQQLKEVHLRSDRPSRRPLSQCLSPLLLSKLVTFECTNYTLSRDDVLLLLRCEKLLHLSVKIARGAEQCFAQSASSFRTLSLEWEPPERSESASLYALHKPMPGLLPRIVANAPELQNLGWIQAELTRAELLEALKLCERRLQSLHLSLGLQSICALQYLLSVVEGIALYNSNIRELKFPLYDRAQGCFQQCICDMQEEELRLAAAVRNVQIHAPFLQTKDLFIIKNQVLRDHCLAKESQ